MRKPRNVVAMGEASGYAPTIIEYLETAWTIQQLEALLTAMKANPRDLLREKDTPALALGLMPPDATDDAVLREMFLHPILVDRPIVATPKGVKRCRPSEMVLELLNGYRLPSKNEDGEIFTQSILLPHY